MDRKTAIDIVDKLFDKYRVGLPDVKIEGLAKERFINALIKSAHKFDTIIDDILGV